jgi:hypothetical protein
MYAELGQDLLLNRTVIERQRVALRGPLSLRLASACSRAAPATGTTTGAQPRTRSGVTPPTYPCDRPFACYLTNLNHPFANRVAIER